MFIDYLCQLENILDYLDLECLDYVEEKNGCRIVAKKNNGEIRDFIVDKKLNII